MIGCNFQERERIALSSKKKTWTFKILGVFFFKPFQLFVWTNEALKPQKYFVYILVIYIILWGQTENENPILSPTQMPYFTISFCVSFFYNQLAKKYELVFFCKQKCITYKIASTTYVQCLLFQVCFLKDIFDGMQKMLFKKSSIQEFFHQLIVYVLTQVIKNIF